MRLLYGTTNLAKLAHMREMLDGLGLEIVGLAELACDFPKVPEPGNLPLENAVAKAIAYHAATGMPTFSCDSGLHLEGVPESDQPGVHVRRVGGCELDDEEMIAHYAALAARHGGRVAARYRNAIALVREDGCLLTHDGEDIATRTFWMIDRPHAVRNPGYPIDAISLDMETDAWHMDEGGIDRGTTNRMAEGYRRFFRRCLGMNGGETGA